MCLSAPVPQSGEGLRVQVPAATGVYTGVDASVAQQWVNERGRDGAVSTAIESQARGSSDPGRRVGVSAIQVVGNVVE
jgi:hypothetical protein